MESQVDPEKTPEVRKKYTPPPLEAEPSPTIPSFKIAIPESNWTFGNPNPKASFNSTFPFAAGTKPKLFNEVLTKGQSPKEQEQTKNDKPKNKRKTSKEKIDERKKRTYTIFNLASAEPSETVIIDAISERFNREPSDILEIVARDTRFRARYNLLFHHEADCVYLKRNGITIAGQKLRGSNDLPRRQKEKVIRIFIPNFPVFGDVEQLLSLFEPYGKIQFLKQRKHHKYDIHIGGWVGAIILDEGCKVPDSITFCEEEYDVVYPGKPVKVKQSKPKPNKTEAEGKQNESDDKSNENEKSEKLSDLAKKDCLNNRELLVYIDEINEKASSPPRDEDMDSEKSNETIKTRTSYNDVSDDSHDELSDSGESYISTQSAGLQGTKTKRGRRSHLKSSQKKHNEHSESESHVETKNDNSESQNNVESVNETLVPTPPVEFEIEPGSQVQPSSV